MQFLVIGSISLLLAVTSYPFGHQGFLMTMLVLLILFVAAIIGSVLLGVNRDELDQLRCLTRLPVDSSLTARSSPRS